MKHYHVFTAWVQGTWTELKALNKENAFKRFAQLDKRLTLADITQVKAINSHQAPVEELYGRPVSFKGLNINL